MAAVRAFWKEPPSWIPTLALQLAAASSHQLSSHSSFPLHHTIGCNYMNSKNGVDIALVCYLLRLVTGDA